MRAPRSSIEPAMQRGEVPGGQLRRVDLRPGREVAPVAGGEIDPDALVAGEDDAGDVQDRDFRHELFIAAQRCRRRRDHRFHVLIKAVAIDIAEVAQLGDQEHDRFRNPLNRPTICAGEASA